MSVGRKYIFFFVALAVTLRGYADNKEVLAPFNGGCAAAAHESFVHEFSPAVETLNMTRIQKKIVAYKKMLFSMQRTQRVIYFAMGLGVAAGAVWLLSPLWRSQEQHDEEKRARLKKFEEQIKKHDAALASLTKDGLDETLLRLRVEHLLHKQDERRFPLRIKNDLFKGIDIAIYTFVCYKLASLLEGSGSKIKAWWYNLSGEEYKEITHLHMQQIMEQLKVIGDSLLRAVKQQQESFALQPEAAKTFRGVFSYLYDDMFLAYGMLVRQLEELVAYFTAWVEHTEKGQKAVILRQQCAMITDQLLSTTNEFGRHLQLLCAADSSQGEPHMPTPQQTFGSFKRMGEAVTWLLECMRNTIIPS